MIELQSGDDELRVVIVSKSDIAGGAARAALRLGCALRSLGHDAEMLVSEKLSDRHWVNGPRGFKGQVSATLRAVFGLKLATLQRTGDPGLRSVDLLPSGVPGRIEAGGADVVNLHWIGGEMMSVTEIGRIARPTIWTLHDMWAFCGAEHYAPDDAGARWRSGYSKANRRPGDTGLDLDRWTWQRKIKAFRRPQHAICPTPWLARCAAESALMGGWTIEAIPNPLDTALFRPWPKAMAREMLDLPADVPLLGFGAMGGTSDPRKGWDLLEPALRLVADAGTGAEIVIFGQSRPAEEADLGLPVHWAGHLTDDIVLALLYSALDLVVVPSRQDNLPQTATEAQSCGCPVTAFGACGLGDAIEDGVTGLLAKPFDSEDLARGMIAILSDTDRRAAMGTAARDRAVRLWDNSVVIPQYAAVYRKAIAHQSTK